MGNEHELVEDVTAQTLIKFLEKGKAPGPDTIHNEVLRQEFKEFLEPNKINYAKAERLVKKMVAS